MFKEMQQNQIQKWIMAGYPPPNKITTEGVQMYLEQNNMLISRIIKNQAEVNQADLILNMAKYQINLKFLAVVAEFSSAEQTPQDPRSSVLQAPMQYPPDQAPAQPGFPYQQTQQAHLYAQAQQRMQLPHLLKRARRLQQPPRQQVQQAIQLLQPAASQQLVQPAALQQLQPAQQLLQPAALQQLQLAQQLLQPAMQFLQPAALQQLQPAQQLLHPAMLILQPATPQQLKPAGPQLLQPAPQMLQPAPQMLQPAPQMLQPAPQMLQPAPHMLQPAPQMLQPAPQMLQPAPQMLQPAPQMLQPAPQMLQPAPQMLQSAPQMLQPAPQLLAPQLDSAITDSPLWECLSPFLNEAPLQQNQAGFLNAELGGSNKSNMQRGKSILGKRPAEPSWFFTDFGCSSSGNQGLQFNMPAGGLEAGGPSGVGEVDDYTIYLNDSEEDN